MHKKAHILIPTVLIKEAEMDPVALVDTFHGLAYTPIGEYKPLNTLHNTLLGSGIGALAGGTIGLGSQYLTRKGRKKSFKKKLLSSIIPTLAGAGIGAAGGGVGTNIARNKVLNKIVNYLYKDGDPTAENHISKDQYSSAMNEYLKNENIRGIDNLIQGYASPTTEQFLNNK